MWSCHPAVLLLLLQQLPFQLNSSGGASRIQISHKLWQYGNREAEQGRILRSAHPPHWNRSRNLWWEAKAPLAWLRGQAADNQHTNGGRGEKENNWKVFKYDNIKMRKQEVLEVSQKGGKGNGWRWERQYVCCRDDRRSTNLCWTRLG